MILLPKSGSKTEFCCYLDKIMYMYYEQGHLSHISAAHYHLILGGKYSTNHKDLACLLGCRDVTKVTLFIVHVQLFCQDSSRIQFCYHF